MSTKTQQHDDWYQKAAEAWDAAAAELEAQGYRCTGRRTRLPIFKKAGQPDLYLARSLGKIDWQPRVR